MKYNYPIKYAAMPIIDQVGWSHGVNELERNYDVVCYIVSKCYLVNDKTIYKANGQSEKEYEVVFPYQKTKNNRWEKNIPSYNVFNHSCTNSNFVERVFDTYEEALNDATHKNKDLCDKTWIYLTYTNDLVDRISKKKEEFDDRLAIYKMLEEQILANTSDINPFNIKELNKIVINKDSKIRFLTSSLYEYLEYSSYSKFIVYSISLEQLSELETLINNQNISDILKIMKNATPILYHDYDDLEEGIKVIDPNGNVLYYISEQEILKDNKEQKIPPVELKNIDSNTNCIFTTETFEDVVLSFSKYKDINLDEIQGPILKKTIFTKNNKK